MRCFTQTLLSSPAEIPDAPEFVKTASVIDAEGAKKLSDSCFGLIVIEKFATQRMLPLHNSAHVWLSAKYLDGHVDGMPKTAAAIASRNVCAAADARGVEVPERLRKLAAQAGGTQTRYYEKQVGDFTVGYPEDEGIGKTASITLDGRVMPIRNIYELGAAEEYFDRNHKKFASAVKYRLANFIAAQRNALTPTGKTASANVCVFKSMEVTKTASLNCYNPGLKQALLKRAAMSNDKDAVLGFVKLAENLKVAAFSGPAALIDTVENLDHRAGLTHNYGSWIQDPISTVLSKSAMFAKTAEETVTLDDAADDRAAGDLDVLMGRPVSVKEVKRSARDGALRGMLGDSLANQLATNPDATLAKLPKDVKIAIASRLQTI